MPGGFPIPSTTGPVSIWAVVPNSFAATIQAAARATRGLVAGSVVQLAAGLVAAGLNNSAVLLGWGERGPRIKVKRAWSRVFSDLSGTELCFDKAWAGQEALVFADLTVWNESVYWSLASAPRPGAFPGGNVPGDVGTFAMTEGAGFPLLLRMPHFDQHPIFRSNGMQAGYRFYCATIADDGDDFETGSAPNKRHLAFHAIQAHNYKTGARVLYDFGVKQLPAVPVAA